MATLWILNLAILFFIGYSLLFSFTYWRELSRFLDQRDEMILKKLRNNKDHKI